MVCTALTASAQQQGIIVRDSLGSSDLTSLCSTLGCTIVRSLGDPSDEVFLVDPISVSANALLTELQAESTIVDAELDQLISLESPALSLIPEGLFDNTAVNYYGTPVWDGYVNQPANVIVNTAETQTDYHISGSGTTVAMIDTGIDPTHPALKPVALAGYDFTRNKSGANEKADLDHSTAAVLDGGGGTPVYVTPWLAAVVSPAGALALSNPNYAYFGHGTMTAGIVHMVAPTAKILPLKVFSANGTGYLSNIVRAIYYAGAHKANVISMSFEIYDYSTELNNAIDSVSKRNLICVASAGNDGEEIYVYPASLSGVMGVASTSDTNTRSAFSNYGSQVVWVAAPGENIISTYPYATYSSSSGTSFSAPFVSGTAALLHNVNKKINQASAAAAIANAVNIGQDLNNGLLDTYTAIGSIEK
jgi:subtilisin family serine protease